MNEEELREMVRASIARQLGGGAAAGAGEIRATADAVRRARASFVRLPLRSGGDDEGGACLIEPAVRCSHCGYCQSYGH